MLLSIAALLFACSGEPKSTRTTIAVIPKGTTHEFWKSIHAGAVKAGRELDVEVIWKGPLREDDRDAQISVVEDFITLGVDGIVLAPLDEVALRVPVQNAANAGIPVVIIDSGLRSDAYTSFIATDNRLGGEIAGRNMASLLDGKGRVIMLRLQEGSESTTNREEGFLAEIAKHPAIEVASANQYGGATTETAYRASENLLTRFKDGQGRLTVDGIFCPNESTTFGMLRALQDGGFAGNVIFIGFDSSAKLVEALEQGELHGLVVQNPFKMGYLGVTKMVEHLNGQPVERRIDTGVAFVDRSNMHEPEIRELILPDLSQWLQ